MHRTPIYLAAKYNHLDVLQILIQRSKIVFVVTVSRYKNYHIVVCQVLNRGSSKPFSRGAKLNIGDHQKITPLLTAVLNGNTEVVSFLLK